MSNRDSPIYKTAECQLWLQRAYNAYYPTEKNSLHIPALPCPDELRPDTSQPWYIYPRNREFGFIVRQETIEEIRWHNNIILLFAVPFIVISLFSTIFLLDTISRMGDWIWLVVAIWFSILVGGIVRLSVPLRTIFAEHEPVYFPEEFTNAIRKKDRKLLLLRSIEQGVSRITGGTLDALQVNKLVGKGAEIVVEAVMDDVTERLQHHPRIELRKAGPTEKRS